MLNKLLLRIVACLLLPIMTACNLSTSTSTGKPTFPALNNAVTPVVPVAHRTVPGCEFKTPNLSNYTSPAFQNPDTITSANGVLHATLDVAYSNHTIDTCAVHLRTYNGKLVGPTLRAKPGDVMHITLNNKLPPNPDAEHVRHGDSFSINSPHLLNTTNLHTHGLHVSPEKNSDNVLLSINPQSTTHYTIEIPKDHPAGTFWYHAHHHGGVAVQMGSGMQGALIIEGGLDEQPDIASAKQHVFVLQELHYDQAGQIESFYDSVDTTTKIFDPCTWSNMQRLHTINGQLYPTLTIAPGELQRWRFIHAGIRENITVELHGPASDALVDVVPTAAVKDILTLPTNNLDEIAVDGIALGRIDRWQQVELEPAYRSDVLVKVSTPGTYYLVDAPSDEKYKSCEAHPVQPSVLAKVIVTGQEQNMSVPASTDLAQYLPFDPLITIDPSRPVMPDINIFDPDFASLNPQPTVPISGFQEVDFNIINHGASTHNARSSQVGPVIFSASDRPFGFDHQRTLKLNSTELWIIRTDPEALYYAHPFHIHVNPFQTWRLGPDGKYQTLWRDTILVKAGEPAYLYMRYSDFIGKFVYHCHILDHEDMGMMELVEIVP